jgi:hypothetical protein
MPILAPQQCAGFAVLTQARDQPRRLLPKASRRCQCAINMRPRRFSSAEISRRRAFDEGADAFGKRGRPLNRRDGASGFGFAPAQDHEERDHPQDDDEVATAVTLNSDGAQGLFFEPAVVRRRQTPAMDTGARRDGWRDCHSS